MGLLDTLITELNANLSEEEKEKNGEWKRLHSPQYQLVQTENGLFRNPVKSAACEREDNSNE